MPGGREPFFDPFAGFGDFGGFGAFGGPGSLASSFFGGRDPFDDPFFTRPFGGLLEPSFFGPRGNPFEQVHPSGFLVNQPSHPPRPSRGPVIEELNSDDEKEEKDLITENRETSRKHGRSSQEPLVEDPDDEAQGRGSKLPYFQSGFNRSNQIASQPQGHSFTFQSSTVSYGGANGTYYAASNVKRTGSDGLTFEESKEANSATGQAAHQVSKGLHDKGHSVMRKLNSDGNVNTMQTLHNLNEDELAGFEEAWKGNARDHLPGLSGWNGVMGSNALDGPSRTGGRTLLPSTGSSHHSTGVRPDMRGVADPSSLQSRGRFNTGAGDGAGSSCSRPTSLSGTSVHQPRRHKEGK